MEATLLEHLAELRRRILICLGAVLLTGIFSYLSINKILDFLARPVPRLFFVKPTEAFLTQIKLSLFCGLFFASPVILYQVWQFISPGLVKSERRYALWLVPASLFLFLGGVAFGFFMVLPVGIRFLLGLGSEKLQPLISVNSYISFVGLLLLGFGLVFQLPLVIIFLTKLGLITPKWLASHRRYAILIIFIVAAALTPGPDIFSQFLMAIPLLILYEVSLWLSRLIKK